MEITRGKLNEPMRAVFYGPEGVGKSSLAAMCPNPVFLDTEGSTRRMSVARLPQPTSYTHMLQTIGELARNPQGFQTLVVDTADWAERICTTELCATRGKDGIEGFGYGKGWVYLAEEFGKLLTAMDDLSSKTGMHIVVTAHAKVVKTELPEDLGSYDKWTMKLSKHCEPLLKEWPDMLLFLTHKIMVLTDDDGGRGKACDSKRVIKTSHAPTYDAKNRDGLPQEIPFPSPSEGYNAIAKCFECSAVPSAAPAPAPAPEPAPVSAPQPAPANTPRQSEAKEQIKSLMSHSGVHWDAVLALCVERGHLAKGTRFEDVPDDFIQRGLIKNWATIVEKLKGAA